MWNGSIADLNNLKFYTESGIEIYTEKQYTITWEFKNENKAFRTLPKGFILADIKPATNNKDEDIYVIDPLSIQIGFTQYPEIFLDIDVSYDAETGMSNLWSYDILQALYYNFTLDIRKNILTQSNNIIVITINLNIGSTQFIQFEIPANKFFSDEMDFLIKDLVLGDCDNAEEDLNEFQKYGVVTAIEPYKDDTDIPYLFKALAGCPYSFDDINAAGTTIQNKTQVFNILELPEALAMNGAAELTSETITLSDEGIIVSTLDFNYNEAEKRYIQCMSSALALYFPFIRYQGSLMQEKTSTDFYAANTLIILEQITEYDEYGNADISYEYPALNASETNWELIFNVAEQGELRILQTNDDVNIIPTLSTARSLAVSNVVDDSGAANPMYLTIGTLSSNEGAYQNYLGLYLSNTDINKQYFFGVISVKVDIIGEDERYRALMENFGIPDPANYYQIFADNDYEEMLCNWEFINKKCKELMLIYQDIFPFAGTYKGLINAIRFLGYEDIIIKEWYNIRDTNGTEKNVAFESIDLASGKLKSLLKKYDVDYTDHKYYHKLNQISIIYHLNEQIQKEKIDDQFLLRKINDGTWIQQSYYEAFPYDIPLTQPIYTYRNDEILAKLYSVKKWLETYIVGINVKISDITAEGIYFVPYKTTVYSNQTETTNFVVNSYATPKLIDVTPLEQSQSTITCSLAEFNNITFAEYPNKTFESFERTVIDLGQDELGEVTCNDITEHIDNPIKKIHISNTIGTAVYGDEYMFELSIRPESGSLCQYTKADQDQIIISDDIMSFLKNDTHTVEFEQLPIIYIEDGNIRHMTGNWETNAAWNIIEQTHSHDWTSYYHIQPKGLPNLGYDCYTHATLIPQQNATLKYTADNKWQVPMLVMTNYKFAFYNKDMQDSILYEIPENIPFIVDISRGRLSFYNRKDDVSTDVLFYVEMSEGDASYKFVNVRYTYRSALQNIINCTPDAIRNIIHQKFFTTIHGCSITDDEYNNAVSKLLHFEKTIDEFKQPFLKEESKMYNPRPTNFVPKIIKDTNGNDIVDSYEVSDVYIYDENGEPLTGEYWDQSVVNHWAEFLRKKEMAKIQNEYMDIVDEVLASLEYLSNNTTISQVVNHIGRYDISVKMYDRYNNIYINKADKSATVKKPVPVFDLIANQSASNNDRIFSRNVDGQLLSYDDVQKIAEENFINSEIKYTVKWPIYHINYDYRNPETVSWLNYTWAIQAPRAGEYMWFRNTRYKVGKIFKNTLYLYDQQNVNRLFRDNSDTVHAIIYNRNTHEIIQDNLILNVVRNTSSIFKESLMWSYMPYNKRLNSELENDQISKMALLPDINDRKPEFEPIIDGIGLYEYRLNIAPASLLLIQPYLNAINSGEYDMYLISNLSYTFPKYQVISDNFINNFQSGTGNITIPDYEYPLFETGDVIKIIYDILVYDKLNINLPYRNTEDTEDEWLLQAVKMEVRPCLYISYKDVDGQRKEHTEIAVPTQYNEATVDLEDAEYIIFFKQYSADQRLYGFLLENPEPGKTITKEQINTLYHYSYSDAHSGVISAKNSFIKGITNHIKFNDNNTVDLTFPIQGQLTNHIHNEVSTRITDIIRNNLYSKEKHNYTTYTYHVSEYVDHYLLKEYENNPLYDLTVSLSYPYKNFVQYVAPVKQETTQNTINYNETDDIILQCSAYIDPYHQYLESYLDRHFQGISYDYNPKYIKETFVFNDDNILLNKDTESFLYHNTPITIDEGQTLWIKPCITPVHDINDGDDAPKDYLESIEEIEWSVYNDMYDTEDRFSYNNSITNNECLYKIRNKSFVIQPNTVGAHTVNMAIWDKYGNKLIKNYKGAFYVNPVQQRKQIKRSI